MPVSLPLNHQYVHLSRHTFLARCNKSFAMMCGCRDPGDLIGTPASQLFIHPDSTDNDILNQFLRGGCRILHGAISNEINRHGDSLYFENTCIGIFDRGRLRKIWGVRQVLTERRQEILRRKKLLDTLTENQRRILEMTVHGNALKEIGAVLSLSINTVESYRMRALRKLELKSVPEFIRLAAPLGLDSDPEAKDPEFTGHATILSR